jgi:hypothetical protein
MLADAMIETEKKAGQSMMGSTERKCSSAITAADKEGIL